MAHRHTVLHQALSVHLFERIHVEQFRASLSEQDRSKRFSQQPRDLRFGGRLGDDLCAAGSLRSFQARF